MVELARHRGGGPVSLAEIADHEDLPRPYLEQLVTSLREAGLVQSTRGAHGGYELTREPEGIRMGEVLRALEGPLAPMVCASEDPVHAEACGRVGFCTVNPLWVRVRSAVSEALDARTVTSKRVYLKAKGSSKKVKATVTYSATGKSIVLKPKSKLKHGKKYTVTATTAVKDLAGNSLDGVPAKAAAQPLRFSFTTG